MNDAATFFYGEDLVGLHVEKALDLLCCRPLHLDAIDDLGFSNAEVKSQIALRHYAGTAVHFIDLRMSTSHYAYARADCGAIARGPDQL